MRTIVHLSDLHFGRVNPLLIDPLIRVIREVEPDLVAISGDLSQRSRSGEFQRARAFIRHAQRVSRTSGVSPIAARIENAAGS